MARGLPGPVRQNRSRTGLSGPGMPINQLRAFGAWTVRYAVARSAAAPSSAPVSGSAQASSGRIQREMSAR